MLKSLIPDPIPVRIGTGDRPRRPADAHSAPGPIATACGLWFLLVGIATLGRLWQPGWNVTPMAGVALAAGAVFPNRLMAASVPLAALAISNVALPAYGSIVMAAVVYAATAWPVLLGGWLRRRRGRQGEARGAAEWISRAAPVVGGSLASTLVFYLSTNFAHWCLTNDYPHTGGGLVSCYVAALPFYRWMPLGDVAWSLAIFGALSLAERLARGRASDVPRAA